MEERILDVLRRTFEEEVDKNVSQKNCDKWDSMNHLNLVIELESEFDISLEPEEISLLTDFEQIKKVISLKM